MDPLIEITVLTSDEDDPLDKWRVDESWLDITVCPDPHDESLWATLRIEEIPKQHQACPPPGVLATEASSLSLIKALWAPD